jgi:hypothetical protein
MVLTQGMIFYHTLKGRGESVEMLMFPKETHPLEGVEFCGRPGFVQCICGGALKSRYAR